MHDLPSISAFLLYLINNDDKAIVTNGYDAR